ncbi:MAG: hypothetical protein K2H85_03740, partial [Allobaculum sp.]|nr:hypothetical protein [Allobaculum sp.]
PITYNGSAQPLPEVKVTHSTEDGEEDVTDQFDIDWTVPTGATKIDEVTEEGKIVYKAVDAGEYSVTATPAADGDLKDETIDLSSLKFKIDQASLEDLTLTGAKANLEATAQETGFTIELSGFTPGGTQPDASAGTLTYSINSLDVTADVKTTSISSATTKPIEGTPTGAKWVATAETDDEAWTAAPVNIKINGSNSTLKVEVTPVASKPQNYKPALYTIAQTTPSETISAINSNIALTLNYSEDFTPADDDEDTFSLDSGEIEETSSVGITGTKSWYTYNTDSSTSSAQTMQVNVVKEELMNRLYNPNSGEHFYTKDTHEKDVLVSLGWQYEGIGWVAPIESDTPIYRLYNPNAGDHHYTADVNEKDTLVRVGWSYEGIGWYGAEKGNKSNFILSSINRIDGIEVFREYNPNAEAAGAHNYTINEIENEVLTSIGWLDEGIAWWALK